MENQVITVFINTLILILSIKIVIYIFEFVRYIFEEEIDYIIYGITFKLSIKKDERKKIKAVDIKNRESKPKGLDK